jgi:hypothetical protein
MSTVHPPAAANSDGHLPPKVFSTTAVIEVNEVPQAEQATSISIPYTKNELDLFQKRYMEGYDLQRDHRYNAWIQETYPDVAIIAQSQKGIPSKTTTPLKLRFVYKARNQEPKLPAIPEAPLQNAKTPQSKILTSEESVRQMESKAKRKEEEAK